MTWLWPHNERRLAEIRKRLEAATPGPWRVERDNIESENIHPDLLADDPGMDPDGGWTVAENVQRYKDAELIANAPADIRFLLDLLAEVTDDPTR